MTTSWQFRGYDRRTTCLEMQCTIGPEALSAVLNLLPMTGDPALIGPHRLDPDQATRVAGLLGIPMRPDAFDYFVEAEEDWRVVADRRQERFLSYVHEVDSA